MAERPSAPPCKALPFERLCVIGMGLIGSSIARAARQFGVARTVIACDRDPAVRARVTELGFADVVTADAAEAVAGADLVILCVPVGANAAVAALIGPHLANGAIVSDVGSVKAAVVAAIEPHLPEGVALVPAHPVAGTEFSGPDAGFATLFDGRWCILTPCGRSTPEAVARLTQVWEAFGSKVEAMSAAHHDIVLGITSHVPHLIAYNIVGDGGRPRGCHAVRGDQVLRGRLPRFHPHRRLRSDDVARRVPA